jgi:hypothetical protein
LQHITVQLSEDFIRSHSRPNPPNQVRIASKSLFLVASVLLHLALLIAVLITLDPFLPSIKIEKNVAPLKSYIIFASPVSPVQPSQKVTLEPNSSPVKQAIEEKQAPSSDNASISNALPILPSPALEQVSDASANQDNAPPVVVNDPVISRQTIDRAVQNYQSILNKQAILKMGEQQAREYQIQKRSPLIARPSVATGEQRESMLRRVEVDCASAAKKGLSIITGLFGGSIECRSHSNIQQYIDKHLHVDPANTKKD